LSIAVTLACLSLDSSIDHVQLQAHTGKPSYQDGIGIGWWDRYNGRSSGFFCGFVDSSKALLSGGSVNLTGSHRLSGEQAGIVLGEKSHKLLVDSVVS
jgi:hypothetical protein